MQKTSSSSIGGSQIPDIKYQKAIKEIGKLVNINTTLKKEVALTQERYESLRIDYENLRECYQQLEASSQERAQHKIQVQQKASIEQDLQNTGSLNEYIDLKNRISELQELLQQRQQRVIQLQQSLQTKHQENIELSHKNTKLEEQVSLLMENIQNLDTTQLQNQNTTLHKNLKGSQQWVAQLTKQIQTLKKQSFMNKITKNQYLPKSSQLLNERPSQISQNIIFSQKIKRLQKQLHAQKQQNKKSKKELKSIKEQKSQQDKKILDLRNFITKQQNYIEKFSAQQLGGYRN